ncbi:MAG: radical SAM protein, partial [Rhodospirillales bacterium]|nr:radical SAM protein [Rhodospirillales bacterium]
MDIQTAREYLQRRISPQESYEDLLNFPRFIEIETVNACNARCPMCTIDDWQRNTPTMKDDLFHRIADEIIDHRDEVNRVSLYRDGEPLLDKKLPERIAYLKQGGVNVTSISTNVSLLDESRSRALLDAGLDMIILSIDSLQKEIFEGIRVRLDF